MPSQRFNIILVIICLGGGGSFASAQESLNAAEEPAVPEVAAPTTEAPAVVDVVVATPSQPSSEDLVRSAWEASGQNNFLRVQELVKQCLGLYEKEALLEQAQLTGFPARTDVSRYHVLNDVGTCLFIQAEAVMNQGRTQDAVQEFQAIINNYPWAQAWDPRGWYWSVAEKSQASIDVLTGKAEEENQKSFHKVEQTLPQLDSPGTESIIDYTKYGRFENVGTPGYQYVIQDIKGLSSAVGEGIYPNTASIYNNPRFKILKNEGRLEGNHWDFVNSNDLEAAYFKWATAPEPWGVKLFYIATIFERAKMYDEALKAYHAIVVHFPKAVSWTYWQTPWYPGQAAIAKIRYILRAHPEIRYIDKFMKIEVNNGFDNIVDNDVFITYPGKIVRLNFWDNFSPFEFLQRKMRLGRVVKTIGEGNIRLVQYENHHWQLFVDNQPYTIKGITYAPTKVGQTPDKGTLENWTLQDTNHNNLIDGPYEAWVDANRNNRQDPNEPVVGDFQLMQEMGVNTIRLYHDPRKPNKELLRQMFNKYGFRVIMGDFLGKYATGSGATWAQGTDYENPEHRNNMLSSVKKMVMEFKDEPYILMWVLGNENNYGVASNADKKPEAFYEFVDEVAQWIKSVDQKHPVAVSNGDTLYLDIFAKHAAHIDVFSANVYRGNYGFGSFWEQVFEATGKPALISEYGCPAYAPHLTLEEGEQAQAQYHFGNWLDIEENLAGRARGTGNALGGVVFEWMDEWWKNYEPYMHDRKSDAIGPFPGGYYFEEWFGVTSQGNGQQSPFMRQLKKVYFLYKDLWHNGL
jgi:beta-glucuronidase